jgi:trehalose-6-phosphate synthase
MYVCMYVYLSLKSRVDRINSKYGDGKTVVYFEERKEKDMRLAQRLAFFAGSDVLMITPTRYQLCRFAPIHTLHHEATPCHTAQGIYEVLYT